MEDNGIPQATTSIIVLASLLKYAPKERDREYGV